MAWSSRSLRAARYCVQKSWSDRRRCAVLSETPAFFAAASMVGSESRHARRSSSFLCWLPPGISAFLSSRRLSPALTGCHGSSSQYTLLALSAEVSALSCATVRPLPQPASSVYLLDCLPVSGRRDIIVTG